MEVCTMGKGRERRLHSREFKLEAVRLVREGGRSKTEVARNLGIHVNLLYKWTNQYLRGGLQIVVRGVPLITPAGTISGLWW